ncbi:thiamine phosphate synthase [Candidatus Margulisiibacteriota bacterium]
MKEKVYRLIDANINRSLEGLRVIEDIARFILDDKKLTLRLKKIRHTIKAFSKEIEKQGLGSRDIKKDVGRGTIKSEKGRGGVMDIFRSNIKRLEESMRVLEEFSKLAAKKFSGKIKQARYEVYDIEKIVSARLQKNEKLNFDLYVVSDSLKVLRQAVAAGAKAVQLRIKDKTKSEVLKVAKKAVKLLKNKATVIINDYPDIAKKAGADGVHVGEGSISVKRARKVVGDDKIVGGSAYNLAQFRAVSRQAPDYIGVGPIFPTPIKAGRKPLKIKGLRRVMKAVTIPIVAIGGIDNRNIGKIVACGISRIAVIRAVNEARDTRKAVRRLIRAIRAS